MAADELKIVVELKASSGDGGLFNGGSGGNEDDNDLTKELKKIRSFVTNPTGEYNKVLRNSKHFGLAMAGTAAISTLVNTSRYYIGRYLNLSENYKGEQTLSNVMNVVEKTKSLGMSVLSGAIMGSKFGGYGAIIGASVAVGTFAVNEGIDYAKSLEQQQIQINTSYGNSAFQMARLGLTDGGRNTEN